MNQRADKPRKSLRTPRKSRGALVRKLSEMARKQPNGSPSLNPACENAQVPPKVVRVHGPYLNGKKWRVVVVDESGRKSMVADTFEEAETIKNSVLRLYLDRSLMRVELALDAYLVEKARDGAIASTVNTLRYKLRHFLPLDATLGEITPQHAGKLYHDETERMGRFGNIVKAATHRGILRMVKAFFRWAVEREYVRANPFERVRPVGKVNAGKAQLRLDEVRRLNMLLLSRAESGDEGALAVIVQLVMGMRSGEVLKLQVRDVDDDGRAIWIDGGKTKNARRSLAVESEPLERLLALKCAGRDGEQLLFGAGRSRPYFTDYLWHRVRKYCALAGVPVVCPHSMRGLHSTLALTRGASSRLVADALGHGDDAVTKRHYIDHTAMRNASIKRVAGALANKPAQPATLPTSPDLTGLADTLRSLAPEQLQALLSSVAELR